MRLCRNKHNNYCTFSATAISSLFATMNATKNSHANKNGGRGASSSLPPPRALSLTFRDKEYPFYDLRG